MEHVVLEDIAARVAPVVGNVRAGVIAHHVGASAVGDDLALTAQWVSAGAMPAVLCLYGKPVHPAALVRCRIRTIQVRYRAVAQVRAAKVLVALVVEGPVAAAVLILRVWHTRH